MQQNTIFFKDQLQLLGGIIKTNKLMNEMSNSEIAKIYENMLNGDSSALFKLQNINMRPKPVRQTFSSGQQKKSSNIQFQKINQSQNGSLHQQHKNEQLQVNKEYYTKALKRGIKLLNSNQNESAYIIPKKRSKFWINSSQQNHIETIEQEKISQKPSVKSNKQTYSRIRAKLPNNTKYKELLPKLTNPQTLPKVQSSNIQQKSINMDDLKPKIPHPKKKHINFKALIEEKKKYAEQFDSKNAEQLKCQIDLMNYHKLNRQFIQNTKIKYGLNFNSPAKYLKSKSPEAISKGEDQKLTAIKLLLNNFKQKQANLDQHLQTISLMLKKNKSALNRFQQKVKDNQFMQYYQRKGYRLAQMQEEQSEQIDFVEPIMTHNDKNSKYSNIMANTRDKKWGLMQRTQYETQRLNTKLQKRVDQSRLKDEQPDNQQGGNNKIIVNQRLKNFLFS